MRPQNLSAPADRRHLLRRVTFAATPQSESSIQGLTVEAAVDQLLSGAKAAPQPTSPPWVTPVWTNVELRLEGTPPSENFPQQALADQTYARENEQLRQWWLREMISGSSPLRENLVLFLHSVFGDSTASVDISRAQYEHNAILRRMCLGTFPALLEAAVTDPGMMLLVGIDENRRRNASERPGRLVLENWTVGAGEFTSDDAKALGRALTGWVLAAPAGKEPPRRPDGQAFRANRRTGLVPTFQKEYFDDGPKTILGSTGNFDAREAMRVIGRHPATARRFSSRLIAHFGVDDPQRALEARLTKTYLTTEGSIEALVRELILSDEFWDKEARWKLIKSPIHLVVGACRALEVADPPLPEICSWLAAAGQKVFDPPSFDMLRDKSTTANGADRLAVRYQLGSVLFDKAPSLGFRSAPAAQSKPAAAPPWTSGSTLEAVLNRLDPAPGFDLSALGKKLSKLPAPTRSLEAIRQIIASPEFQIA